MPWPGSKRQKDGAIRHPKVAKLVDVAVRDRIGREPLVAAVELKLAAAEAIQPLVGPEPEGAARRLRDVGHLGQDGAHPRRTAWNAPCSRTATPRPRNPTQIRSGRIDPEIGDPLVGRAGPGRARGK